ncbi:TetR family transcriptional regulator [Agrococcus lahaulensis]|uniref:TetR/AcrR family transcriptional regulator n=1 Tax=Agrococcus sediminis TaxID=2599924 RepID=UPI000FE32E2B|nr:TetR family transcriptional regulator [Agrococcus lahaulensis]
MPESAPTPEPGLRERKKLFTRRTIADAAFALVSEKGLDEVTIDQIAERAFVSPRTVSNYFPSKEAALVAAGDISPIDMLAGLEERPADEAPLHSLSEVLTASISGWSKEQLKMLKAKEDLVERFPALLPHRMAQYDEFEDAVRLAVAARSGVDPETSAFPRLIAGVAAAAIKTAIRVWVNTDGGASKIADLVEQAFHDLEAGLSPDA